MDFSNKNIRTPKGTVFLCNDSNNNKNNIVYYISCLKLLFNIISLGK